MDNVDLRYGEEIELELFQLSFKTKKYLKNFACGNTTIDKYFKEDAESDSDSASFIFWDKGRKQAVAVYSLSCSGITIVQSEKVFVYPAVEIKYFAVNTSYQHLPYSNEKDSQTLSVSIFNQIIFKICEFTDNQCGASRVVLYSVEKAINFYKRLGFVDFEELMRPDDAMYLEGCKPLFLPL